MASNLVNRNPKRTSLVESIRVRVPSNDSSSSSSSSLQNPRIGKQCCNHVSDGCSSQFLIQNDANFNRSALPARFMFYQDEAWVEFGNDVVVSVRSGFLNRTPTVELCIGESKYLFDFLRMLQIDFASGSQRSVAWIDDDGKCFFPKCFVSEEFGDVGESEDTRIEIEVRVDCNGVGRKREVLGIQEEAEVNSSNKHGVSAKRQRLITDCSERSRWPNAKMLGVQDQVYSMMKNFFLSEIRKIHSGAVITAIHQCIREGPLEKARREVFLKQVEITRAARGATNSVCAWHWTSVDNVTSILAHGFAMPSKLSGSEAHGVGIYLSPLRSPHIRAMVSETDNNGEKHAILCRVILGNVEKVEAGSQVFRPSSVNFDTGADDPNHPKWHVVWCANMNSHILPEFILSYKFPNDEPGQGRENEQV